MAFFAHDGEPSQTMLSQLQIYSNAKKSRSNFLDLFTLACMAVLEQMKASKMLACRLMDCHNIRMLKSSQEMHDIWNHKQSPVLGRKFRVHIPKANGNGTNRLFSINDTRQLIRSFHSFYHRHKLIVLKVISKKSFFFFAASCGKVEASQERSFFSVRTRFFTSCQFSCCAALLSLHR